MIWKNSGIPSLKVGGRYVPVKTLQLKDKWGQKRRYRVQTIQDANEKRNSPVPAWSQLTQDEKGKIGALITAAHGSGWLKIGKLKKVCPYLFVSLDALPKLTRKKLLIPLNYELVEEEDIILAKEKEPSPYYVGSVKSNLFHQPGCWQANRIGEGNRVMFKTRQEALQAGYTAHRVCGE